MHLIQTDNQVQLVPDDDRDMELLQAITNKESVVSFHWVDQTEGHAGRLVSMPAIDRVSAGDIRTKSAEIVSLWNSNAEKNMLSRVSGAWSVIHQQRLGRLMRDGYYEKLVQLIPQIHKLPFYTGRNDTGWKLSLWWLLQKRDKITELLHQIKTKSISRKGLTHVSTDTGTDPF